MTLFNNTRDALVERICRLVLHDWWEGTATAAGSTTTFVDSARPEADDYFNNINAYVYFRTGTYASSEGKISDWVGASTYTGTFAPALAGAPGTGSVYSIHAQFRRAEINEAIQMSLDMVAREALFFKTDETTITLEDDVFEYPVPSDFVIITSLTMAGGNGNFYDAPINPSQYKIVKGAIPVIHFSAMGEEQQYEGHWWHDLWSQDDTMTAARKLRVEGLAKQPALVKDTDAIFINPTFVVYQAGALLLFSRVRRPENEPDEFRVRAQIAQARADAERAGFSTRLQLPPDSKRVVE
jgi:hypothetical protein